jgi:hypothetical protein
MCLGISGRIDISVTGMVTSRGARASMASTGNNMAARVAIKGSHKGAVNRRAVDSHRAVASREGRSRVVSP